jgi:putative DNA primase/helicase
MNRDAIGRFRDAISAAGINPPDVIEADGKLRRFPTNGKRGDDSGWYVLYGDGIPAGAFGDWRAGLEQTWRQDVGRELSLAEREAQRERIAVVRQQREAEEAQRHCKTRQRAADIWEQSVAPTTNHPYLKRKGVAAHGLLMYRGDDLTINGLSCKFALVVPMRDATGELHSLEFIGLHGEKRFLPGGRIAACYFTIGTPNGRVCICEGFATGASVHEATGEAVAVASNASNLEAVARALREKMPEAQIIVCADDDYRTVGNPGLTKATEAARAIGGLVAIPDFGADRPEGATDFNDLTRHRGPEAVKQAIANARAQDKQSPQLERPNAIEADSWPPLCPLELDDVPREYPLAALPAAICSAVEEVVGFVQCPAALAACSALSAISAAVQALADVERDARLSGPSSLYFLAVAESGERKTECDKHFLGAIRSWELEQSDLFRVEVAKYDADLGAWEARRAGIKERIKGKAKKKQPIDDDKNELAVLEESKPDPVRVPRLLYADTTPEALGASLAIGWPSGAVVSSEAGTVFGGHGMQRESIMRNLALLNSAWDGISQPVDRRGAGHYLLAGARLSMGLAAQPDTVRTFIDASRGLARGSGFASRFLIAWPQSTQGQRLYRPPGSWAHVERFGARLLELLHIEPTRTKQGTLAPPALRFTSAAQKAWIDFYNDVERELRAGGDMTEIRDVASKAADNAARLACLFHVFQHGPSGSIDEECVRSAAQIVGWHLYEARRFLGDVAMPRELADARKLDAWLVDRCRRGAVFHFGLRELQQLGPNSVRKKSALKAAIAELVEAGRARLTLDGKRVMVRPELLGDGNGAA